MNDLKDGTNNVASDPEPAEAHGRSSQPSLAEPARTINWQSELESLHRENTAESGRLAKAIVKYPDFSIVLMVMKSKAQFPEHKSAGRISVQVIKGHIQMHVLGSLWTSPPETWWLSTPGCSTM